MWSPLLGESVQAQWGLTVQEELELESADRQSKDCFEFTGPG